MRSKVALHNLGCKVNAYELEAMQELLEKDGYEIVPFAPGADIYIINTCTVTNIADRKSRQMLHKAKKMNRDAIVVATGCYVQAAKEELKVDEAIDLVIGNNQKQHLVEILKAYDGQENFAESVIDINHTKEYENLNIQKTAEHTRAYIKVQDGCNQFCSYCIIPFARGRVRSRSIGDVVSEVERLVENGYKEVVLTGIHLSSYGTDFEGEKESLLSLIEKVHELEGLKRIRLGSLEPRIISEHFAQKIAGLSKVCPHFHLSLQSGCDETLKRMNRRYDSKEYFEKCQLLRSVYENPAITTDIIVGFPGETEEEFEATRKFVEKVKFFETHIFKYSKRNGTKAAKMENQVADDEKTKRSKILISIGKKHEKTYIESYLEKDLDVLIEERVKIGGESYWLGHTKEYIKVALQSDENLENSFISCKANRILEGNILLGK
ncbi:MAG TPA: tRNA (N(6)-L-threonylcarbamoyladenosine(37)-C(2))-methylthiotransferase MtaB [Lachnospiraceae bacterium]